jgi:hypothetical protein
MSRAGGVLRVAGGWGKTVLSPLALGEVVLQSLSTTFLPVGYPKVSKRILMV